MPAPTDIVSIYDQWVTGRDIWLNDADDVAKITLPGLRPRGEKIQELPFTSLGAMAIRSLSSSLHRILFPPQVKWIRLQINTDQLIQVQTALEQMDPQSRATVVLEIDRRLAELESILLNDMAQLKTRSRLASTIRRNLVEGNTAIHIDDDGMRVFPLRNFVTFREAGEVAVLVTREEFVAGDPNVEVSTRHERLATDRDWLYTHIDYREGRVTQQTWTRERGKSGVEEVDSDVSQWFVVVGDFPDVEHYAYSYASDHQALFGELNHLSQSLAEAAAAAAWNIPLVRPGAAVDPSDLENRPSGQALVANPEDLSWFTSGIKISDWAFVSQHRTTLSQELAAVFALGIKDRVTDRATATEILQIAQELDAQTADLLTAYEETLQRPLVKALMIKNGLGPVTVGGVDDPIKIVITTGQNALQRETAIVRTVEFASLVKQLDPTMLVDGVALMERGGAAMQFETEGLFQRQPPPEAAPAQGPAEEQVGGGAPEAEAPPPRLAS